MRIDKTTAIETLSAEIERLDGQITENTIQIVNLQNALLDPQCSSEAYDAISERVRSLRIPVAQAHNAAFEAILEANAQNISMISGLPETSSGVLDTSECDAMIGELNEKNSQLSWMQREHLSSKNSSGFSFNGYWNLIEMNNGLISDLEAKKTAAWDYARASGSIYSSAKAIVSGILQSSTDSVNSYLATGTYGDTSWVEGAATAYTIASERHRERKLLELSNMGDGIAIISDDYQYIYYKGKKWEIEKYRDSDAHASPYGSISSPFTETDSIYLAGDILMQWGKLLSGFSLPDPKMNLTDGSGYSTGKSYSSTVGGSVLTIGLTENLLGALDRARVKLVFSSNGTTDKVTIYGGLKSQIDQEEAALGGGVRDGQFWPTSKNPKPQVKSYSWDYCNKLYKNATGGRLDSNMDYRYAYTPDSNRGKVNPDGNYYDLIYFDSSGKMVSAPISWPEDRHELWGSDGSEIELGSIKQDSVEASDEYKTILKELAG